MEVLSYLIKVNLYWILFYACYWLLLRKHTFFHWNRGYLLGSLLISFVLPAMSIAGQAPVIEHAVYAAAAIPVYVSTPQSDSYFNNWMEFVWILQTLGAVLMLSRLFEALRDLRAFIQGGETIDFDDHTLILLPNSETGSFSFLKWIVISRNDYEDNFDVILRHETVHVRQMHSVDILLIELLKSIFWFNPALWLYKRSLQEVHEFLADEQAPNRDQYTSFLVSYALNTPIASLTNHFFNSSLLLNRVKMIYKNRNSNWSLSKYLVIIPVIGLMMLLTSARERLLDSVNKHINTTASATLNITIEGTVSNMSGEPVEGATVVVKGGTKGATTNSKGYFKIVDLALNNTLVISHINYQSAEFYIDKNSPANLVIKLRNADNIISGTVISGNTSSTTPPQDAVEKQPGKDASKPAFSVVEQKPEFPGGQAALSQYLSQNILYPAEALENKTQGEVTVSFIVNEKGYVRSPSIVKGLGSGIDEEAVRVVLSMPKWNPGIQGGKQVPVRYSMPIQFSLSAPANTEMRQGYLLKPSMPTGLSLTTFGTSNPLVIIDGIKQQERGTNGVSKIDPDKIQSINVLKGQSATTAYGEEGRDGVLIIKTKK
jgi:TonB family protein